MNPSRKRKLSASPRLASVRVAPSPPRAFTLIELLTVITIIGILAGIIIPTVGRVRESARRADCVSNMRQIGQALFLYTQDHKNHLPPVSTTWPADDQTDTWCYAIWTYARYDKNSFVAGANDFVNDATHQSRNLFQCRNTSAKPIYAPLVTSQGTGWACYGLNDGPLYGTDAPTKTTPVALHLVETPSKTAMILESRFYWANDYAWSRYFGLLPHDGASNIAFYDGHVELKKWPEIQTRGGQERLFWCGRGAW
ncbi:MAG: DUF1559 domain-containing protein [Opitutaceae bacterium]|jgi:general secretion pathway protein G|nr:DUF1559 domain-containing protein [Opitutaceae bacterium]